MKQFSFTGVLIMVVHYFAMAQMGVLGEDSKQLLLRNRLLWPEEKTERFFGGYRRAASFEIPNMTKPGSILSQNGFSAAYSEQHEQALWVAYALTAKMTVQKVGRRNLFKTDPKVKTHTANDADYAGSGFDRGHLVPAADMGWSSKAMHATFYYSNISPQIPAFNRGVWKRLEVLMREWAKVYNKVYIVTGPVLTDSLGVVGQNQVTVPRYFYKVVLDYRAGRGKAIGFVLPNQKSQRPLWEFAVSVDSVELLTGIDFFPQVPDDVEENVERIACVPCWEWGGEKPDRIRASQRNDAMVQCSGITQKGKRCKRKTNSPKGLCFQHGGS